MVRVLWFVLFLAACALILHLWTRSSETIRELEPRHAPVEDVTPRARLDLDGTASVERTEESLPDEPAAAPASLEDGLVVRLHDRESEPVRGAEVVVDWTADDGQDETHVAHTDERGEIRCPTGDPEQLVHIEVTLPNRPTLQAPGPFATLPEEPDTILLRLLPPARLNGIVKDVTGAAVPRAFIEIDTVRTLNRTPHVQEITANQIQVTADENGRFDVTVPQAHYALTARAPGQEPVSRAFASLVDEVREATVELTVLNPGREVAITVLDGGQPAPRATVKASCEREDYFIDRHGVRYESTKLLRFARRGSRGHYRLAVPDHGEWILEVECAGFRPVERVVPPGVESLRIDLVPDAESGGDLILEGRLEDLEGNPLFGELELLEADEIVAVRVATRGTFRFGGKKRRKPLRGDGVYVLRATSDEHAPGHHGPFRLDELSGPVVVRLAAARTLRGQVVDAAGRGVASSVLCLHPMTVSGGEPEVAPLAEQSLETDSNGHFEFRGVGDAECTLIASPHDARLELGELAAHPGDSPVRIVLASTARSLRVSGFVRDASTGEPVHGALIELMSGGTTHGTPGRSDAGGRYAVRAPRVDSPRLRCTAPGYAAIVDHSFVAVAGLETLDLELQPARTLHLRIETPSADALYGLSTRALSLDGVALPMQDEVGLPVDDRRSDANGRIDLLGLPAARIQLEFFVAERDAARFARWNDSSFPLDSTQRVELDLTAPSPELRVLTLP